LESPWDVGTCPARGSSDRPLAEVEKALRVRRDKDISEREEFRCNWRENGKTLSQTGLGTRVRVPPDPQDGS
jgi:hypothetical protein